MSTPPFGTTAPSAATEQPAYEPEVFGFAILWCKEEPDRVGEVGLFVPFEEMLGGRGQPGLEGFLRYGRHRPGAAPVLEPADRCLADSRISREQFRATAKATFVDMVVTGGCRTFVNERGVKKGESVRLVVGDLVLFRDAALFLVVRRKRIMPPLKNLTAVHPYGKADSLVTVGENPRIWEVRDQVALAASRHNHVLFLGESGTGKEALAKAIHSLSPRAKKVLNSVNAAGIAPGIVAAEIFGGIANFPNAGVPARDGLLPVADGGTVFLDEIGCIPDEEQMALSRALESGEYHKVGESRSRRLTATIVGAMSAAESALRPDLFNRFARKIRLPPLRERREDIPLILRHLVLREARLYPEALAPFLEEGPDGELYPRVTVELVAALMQHPLPGNVRQVYDFLLLALAESTEGRIGVPRELAAAVAEQARSKGPPSSEAPSSGPAESGPRRKCTKEEVEVALEKAGSVQRAGLMLGVPRRTLRNWMTEYGLAPKDDTE